MPDATLAALYGLTPQQLAAANAANYASLRADLETFRQAHGMVPDPEPHIPKQITVNITEG